MAPAKRNPASWKKVGVFRDVSDVIMKGSKDRMKVRMREQLVNLDK